MQVLRHVKTIATDPAVLVGLEPPDDAAVYRLSDEVAVVQTVDFFTPIVDDPFDWGRIAAANAISDIYAMGGQPRTALNLVGWPRSLDFSFLGRVLEGGEAICSEAGVVVVGGHTVDDPEPKFGLSVMGLVDPGRIVSTRGARPDDVLVLTKALGTGIISSGLKEGVADPMWVQAAVDSMVALNRDAAAVMTAIGVNAATDVTGFGFLGHLHEMLGEALDAVIQIDEVPLLPGALELAARGVYPGGSKRNRTAGVSYVDFVEGIEDALCSVLFDAQTSGGLLMAVEAPHTADLIGALAESGVSAASVGRIVEGVGKVKVAKT